MIAPQEKLKRRVYNVTAMSFTPEELAAEISKHIPELTMSYRPDTRQDIGELRHKFGLRLVTYRIMFLPSLTADSWPQLFDDSEARADWGWRHKYDIHKLVERMIADVKKNYLSKVS